MRDPRLDKLAEVLVRYCAMVQKGDLVAIVGELHAMPAIKAIFEAAIRAGGYPSFHPRSEELQEILLRCGVDEQIQHVCPFEEHRLSKCDVLIVLNCQGNSKFLGRADPAKVAMARAARRGLLSMSLQRMA